MRETSAPPADQTAFFVDLAGPAIANHGTTAQRDRFLRSIFSGEDR